MTKVGLYETSGKEVAWAGRRSLVTSPRPGWQERDPYAVWDDVVVACREVMRRAEVAPSRVVGVAVSGYTDGLCLIDARGAPVRPAILATDGRAESLAVTFATGRHAQRLMDLTGQLPFMASTPVVLAWIAEHEPDAVARASWLVGCKDWIRYQMTGGIGTDRSEASASFTALTTGAWSTEALELYGLGTLRRLLPEMVPGSTLVGHLTKEAASSLGLAAETPVIAGAHDVDAAALGMAAVADGQASMVLGSFCINQVVSERPMASPAWQTRSFTTSGRWVHMSTSAAGTVTLDWFLRNMYARDRVPGGVEVAVSRALTRTGRPAPPCFLPFVVGAPQGTAVGGSFLGLRDWHDMDDVLRGVLEGIVFNHRSHLAPLAAAFGPWRRLALCGGGAHNRAWAQLMTDVVGIPVEVPAAHEVGAHGAALLAGVGVGVYGGLEEAVRALPPGRRHEPDQAAIQRLDERYAIWRAAVDDSTA